MMETASRGAFNFGEYLTVLKNLGTPLAVAVGVWLRGKYSRQMKLKFKDIAVEGSSVEEVEKLLMLAAKHCKAIGHK